MPRTQPEQAVTLEQRPYDDVEVQRLVAEVQAEYVALYGGPDAAVVESGEFDPPRGVFVVARLDGSAVATGGWRRLDGDVFAAEIKRMYVVAAARRRGIARLVLAELERLAVQAGMQRIVLNTGDRQPAAIALYEAAGYLPVIGFGRYACSPGAVFLGRSLGGEPGR